MDDYDIKFFTELTKIFDDARGGGPYRRGSIQS